jgi:hypothetical protein
MSIKVPVKLLKALIRFTSDKVASPQFQQVCFENTGYAVATDGHAMMVARIAPFDGLPFAVPVIDLEKLVSSSKKDALVDVVPSAYAVDFPQWQLIMPKSLSEDPAQYAWKYLKRIQDARKDLGYGLESTCMIPNGTSAGVAVLTLAEADKYLYLVMPMFAGLDNNDKQKSLACKFLN